MTATVLATSVFLEVAAFGHAREMLLRQNYSANNAGPILYGAALLPVVLVGLLIAYRTAPASADSTDS